MKNLIKKLFHKHQYTNKLTVSGYGYTEYEVWFCNSPTGSVVEMKKRENK